MDDRYPPIMVRATSDEVLAVLRDQHRQQCRFDCEAEPDVALTRDATVADWRLACDLVAAGPLGRALNAGWSVALSDGAWRAVLEPAKSKTLGGVCDLLAAHALLPAVRPATLLRSRCKAAGVFLTVRSWLADAGADPADVGPSTPLAEYARRYTDVFLGPVARLAPGRLPPVTIRHPAYDGCMLATVLGLVGEAIGWCGGSPTVTLAGAFLAVAGFLGVRAAARALPSGVEFDGLQTFRDLAELVAPSARVVPNERR